MLWKRKTRSQNRTRPQLQNTSDPSGIDPEEIMLYFAPNLYSPVDLDELFLLGYALVLLDSSLVVFLGIKLCILLWTKR